MSDAPKLCRCGRPRSTPEDLVRWRELDPADLINGDPAWARAICWTSRPIDECNMKHISTMEPK